MNLSAHLGGRFANDRARRGASAVVLAALALLLPTVSVLTPASAAGPAAAATDPVAASPSSARTWGSLDVTPKVYIPGQAVRFRGNLGISGKRPIHLQVHMNRVGDRWVDLPDFAFHTDVDGDFDFAIPAPAMFNVSYRVVGKGAMTRSFVFDAVPPEITLTPVGGRATYPFHPVAAGRPFTVVADATPDAYPALGTPPAIPGRTVVLQQRVAPDRWRTIDTGTADAFGHTTFTVTAPRAGQLVLRVRQERWTEGVHRIGWFASFPAYFYVRGTVDLPRRTGEPAGVATRAGAPVAEDAAADVVARTPARPTASERYLWGPTLYDFGWTRGEDLSSPPARGTRPRGRWVETSDGTGRAAAWNGQLVLQSRLGRGGLGDAGSAAATLVGNSQRHGRWEFRIYERSWDVGDRPYRLLLELVAPGTPAGTCAARGIVVAGFDVGSLGMDIGVRRRDRDLAWHRTLGLVPLALGPVNVAVEVGREHITWFLDGRPIGTVKGKQAQLGTALVPRMSLLGGWTEMNNTQVQSDWQRSWTLERGQQVRSAPALRRTAYSPTC